MRRMTERPARCSVALMNARLSTVAAYSALLALALLAASLAGPPRADAQVVASGDSVAPAGTVSLTPSPQPPLAQLAPEAIPAFRRLFNRDSSRTRLVVLVSPSCPFCKRGVDTLVVALSRDYTDLAIYVVWEHVTKHDREGVGRDVLMGFSDPRARQFWDPERALSDVVVTQLPADTLDSVSEKDAAGERVAWDCVLLYHPGVRWGDRLPVPDWSGRPIIERIDGFLAALRHAEHQHPGR